MKFIATAAAESRALAAKMAARDAKENMPMRIAEEEAGMQAAKASMEARIAMENAKVLLAEAMLDICIAEENENETALVANDSTTKRTGEEETQLRSTQIWMEARVAEEKAKVLAAKAARTESIQVEETKMGAAEVAMETWIADEKAKVTWAKQEAKSRSAEVDHTIRALVGPLVVGVESIEDRPARIRALQRVQQLLAKFAGTDSTKKKSTV